MIRERGLLLLLVFCVEVNESFHGSDGSFRERFHASRRRNADGSFRGIKRERFHENGFHGRVRGSFRGSYFST